MSDTKSFDAARPAARRGAAGWLRAGACVVLVAASVVGGCQCGSRALQPEDAAGFRRETARKVLLLGMDGATWHVMDPLLARGLLPNFQRLIQRGSRGVLLSMRPMKSPILWTSIATGQPEHRHGIHDFTTEGNQLVSAHQRQVSAMWEWASAFNATVGFVGWWASWPAPAVNGWLISDRAVRDRWLEWTDTHETEGMVYPASLTSLVRDATIEPRAVRPEDVAEIAELSPPEAAEFVAAEAPIFGHWLSVLKFAWANQRSYEEIGLQLLARQQPDLTAIFLVATDPISHTFWHFYEPQHYADVDPEAAARLGSAVPNIYRHNDAFLGRLLDVIDPETTIIVVSDHGFQASGIVPQREARANYEEFADGGDESMVAIGQSGRHHHEGVIIASGPGIVPGRSFRAGLLDVAPTVMTLLGLPVARDAAGQPIEAILDRDAVSPPPEVDTYERFVRRGPVGSAPRDDAELRKRLKSLGYIQ